MSMIEPKPGQSASECATFRKKTKIVHVLITVEAYLARARHESTDVHAPQLTYLD